MTRVENDIKTRTLGEYTHLPRYVMISKWGNLDLQVFMYIDPDPDHSQNVMESKLDQDLSSSFFHVEPTSSICLILLTNKLQDKWSCI